MLMNREIRPITFSYFYKADSTIRMLMMGLYGTWVPASRPCTVQYIGSHWSGSGMFIPDPDVYPGSWFFPIPDPGSRYPGSNNNNNKRDREEICCLTFFVAINFTKYWKLFYFKQLRYHGTVQLNDKCFKHTNNCNSLMPSVCGIENGSMMTTLI